MLSYTLHRPLFTLLQILTLVSCVAGAYYLWNKAGLPVEVRDRDGSLLVFRVEEPSAAGGVEPGDTLLTVAGHTVRFFDEVEFVMDGIAIGSPVHVAFSRAGQVRTTAMEAVRFYSVLYLVTMCLASGLFFAVGVYVYHRRPGDNAARVYHLGSLGSAIMLACTSSFYATDPPMTGYALRFLFYSMYAIVPALFFHFTALFPRRKWELVSRYATILYLLAGVLAVGTSVTMVLAISEGSVDQFRIHYHWFSVTRWFFVGTVVAGLWNIRHTYLTTGDESERRRLRWVLWGLFIGFVPFVFLWVIPQSILHHGLMPEEFIVLFSGMIPLAFGISIVRYHIMNIDLIFQRSVVYGTVMGILVTVYVSLVGFVATLVTRVTEDLSLLIAGGSAMAVALLFQPLRRFVQDEVDRRFFRVAYDYRVAQREFLDSITRAFSVPDLAQVLIQRTDALIPVERIACCELRPPEDRITLVAQRGFDHLAGHSLRSARAGLPSRLALPVALPDQIEPGVPCEEADGQVFRRWGLALLFTFVSTDDRFLGFLALGPKRSGLRFTSEDVDLLRTVVTRAAAEIERISLQEELLRKRGEMEHLRVLNEVKSEFVSYVSHELKTPLTSIKMFAQLLMSRDSGLRPKAREYLRIIEGEADRLNRMVSTILEATRIERGMKTYSFRPLDLVDVTKSVMATMRYQMHKDKFRVRFRHPRTRRRGSILPFVGDRDAIAEVLINLLSNAMKYSDRERKIDVTLAKSGDGVSCRVDDRGRGIAPEALPHVFEKFYRDTNTAGAIQGVGLGLSVVKHVMDAHGGSVQVSSTPGKGTSILLWFPSRPVPATVPEKEPRYEENSPR